VPEEALPAGDGDRLEVLAVLAKDIKRQHDAIAAVDPIEAIEFMFERKACTHANLEPLAGGRGRVSEVLARKRALSITMIRELPQRLSMPPEVLVAPYDLRLKPPSASQRSQAFGRECGQGPRRAGRVTLVDAAALPSRAAAPHLSSATATPHRAF